MARIDTLDNFLTDVADSIREKKGTTDTILAKNFDTEIESISGGSSSDEFYINDCSYLFYNGARIDQFNNLKKYFKDVVNAFGMFAGTYSEDVILDLSGFDTSKIQNFGEFFRGLRTETLDLSGFDTSSANNMYYFFGNSTVKSLDLSSFDGTNVKEAASMFYNCMSLTELILGNFNLNKVESLANFFYNNRKLKKIDLSKFDFANIKQIGSIFYSCQELTELTFGTNLGKSYTIATNNYFQYGLALDTCPNLTHESLLSVINNLYDLNLSYNVANGGKLYTQKLTLGSVNLSKLTQDEIQIATNKGWTVS